MFRSNLIIGVDDVQLSKQDIQLLTLLKPCGIILFSRNFDDGRNWFKWYKRLVEDICKKLETNRLILSVDHEGGRVVRFPPPFTRFPYPAEYRHFARHVAQQMAEELKLASINLTYSPCVDVNSNPKNPVIGPRAFSSNPTDVVKHAQEFIQGLTQAGLSGCLKHYPGHGDTLQDSHFSLPVVEKTFSELESCELIPYKHLSRNARFVMTAHVLYPKIDQNPATLSRFLIQYLRNQIGFNGLVICDDIEMKALADYQYDKLFYHLSQAGIDIVLYARNEKLFDDYLLKQAIDKNLENLRFHNFEFLENFKIENPELNPEIFEKGKTLVNQISSTQHI